MKLLIITKTVDQNDQLLGFSVNWFHRFAEKFDKIIILCLEKGEFNLPSNVEVLSLGKDRGYSKIRQLATLYFLLFTRRRDYDAVFSFMGAIWIVIGAWLWRLLGKKIYLWYAHKTITWKHRLAEKWADGIFTSTPGGFRIKSKKMMVVGQGIDTSIFMPINHKQLVPPKLSVERGQTTNHKLKILSVGRIAPIKNYEILIRAIKIASDDGTDLNLTMIGEPVFPKDFEYENKLKNLVSETGLDNEIDFIGKIINKELPQYYQSNDMFINLGKTGSLDKTIVEAMACNLKVISSNEAAEEFLPKELIVSGDDPKELAEKIKEIANKDFDGQLREYVIKNHSLTNLIERISTYIKRFSR